MKLKVLVLTTVLSLFCISLASAGGGGVGSISANFSADTSVAGKGSAWQAGQIDFGAKGLYSETSFFQDAYARFGHATTYSGRSLSQTSKSNTISTYAGGIAESCPKCGSVAGGESVIGSTNYMKNAKAMTDNYTNVITQGKGTATSFSAATVKVYR